MESGAAGATGPRVCLEQRHGRENATIPRQKTEVCLVKEAVIRREVVNNLTVFLQHHTCGH